MLVSRLLRSLLSFLSMGIVPDEGGGAASPAPAPAPEVDTPAPSPAPEATDAPAPAPAPEDDKPFDITASLNKALDLAGQGEEAPKPEATPAPTPAPAPAAKKPDAPATPDMDLTPPDGITDRSRERWNQLAERAKLVPQLEAQHREATQQLESVRSLVADSGLDANEFTDMLEMARLFKAGDPKALQQLDGLRQELASRLGVEVPGVDPLEAHPDLKADVEAMNLTKERALELARLRSQGQQHQQVTQQQQERQTLERSIQQASAAAEAELSKRAGTPGHEQKMAYIAQYLQQPGKMQEFVATYQPKQWASVLGALYDAYVPPAAPAPAVPQPLRPGNTRAGAPVRSGPVTSETAVAGAFDRLGL